MRVLLTGLAGAISLIWISAAAADSLPAFYDVSDVAANDVLNVRAAPQVGAAILSTLEHDATGIEIVAQNAEGDWGQINLGEQAGWVALRFMTRLPGQPEDQLPRPLQCAGTEPFWSLTLPREGPATLTRMDEEPLEITTLDPVTSVNRTDRYAVFGQGDERVASFIFHRDTCSDNMSDRVYGMSVDVILTEQSGVSYGTGCCNLAR
ncbi:MAG: hypothetical protein AAGA28_04970 [Pseudomonadota bacterium]